MKTEICLNLTEDQLDILKGFLVVQLNQLKEEQLSLVVCKDFTKNEDDIHKYFVKLKEIEKPMADFEDMLNQLLESSKLA